MQTKQTLGTEFNKRHDWLLNTAKKCGVAICGGCAAAITKDNKNYVPKDIDFATDKAGALKFINTINEFLLKKSAHFRIYANSRNDFVPSQAVAHFRITCGFWLPVCLFVLPDDKFRFYRIEKGHMLQFYEDVKQAAYELTAIDGKPRIANEDYDLLNGDLVKINTEAVRVGSGSKNI